MGHRLGHKWTKCSFQSFGVKKDWQQAQNGLFKIGEHDGVVFFFEMLVHIYSSSKCSRINEALKMTTKSESRL